MSVCKYTSALFYLGGSLQLYCILTTRLSHSLSGYMSPKDFDLQVLEVLPSESPGLMQPLQKQLRL